MLSLEDDSIVEPRTEHFYYGMTPGMHFEKVKK